MKKNCIKTKTFVNLSVVGNTRATLTAQYILHKKRKNRTEKRKVFCESKTLFIFNVNRKLNI
jgi:hypothetical protein